MSGPIIILGSHRSGTTIVTKLLAQFGLYTGADANNDVGESRLFIRLNDWILRQAGARWDAPEMLAYLNQQNNLSASLSAVLERSLSSPLALLYLGWKKTLRYYNLKGIQGAWGWKDPRNTLTLPFWLQVFPDAKVVCIFRHGVDVANSLRLVEHQVAERNKDLRCPRTFLGVAKLFLSRKLIIRSARCMTLEGAFGLWDDYMQATICNTAALEGRLLQIQYEKLLANPTTILSELVAYCGLSVSEKDIAAAAAVLDPTRAFAYLQDAELKKFAVLVAERLACYGYSATAHNLQ